MIKLTEQAASQAESWRLREADYAGKDLRLYVNGKGCDGFFYGVCFDTLDKNQDSIFPVTESLSVGIDTESLDFVEGTMISWVDDERGKGFWVDNPDHNKFRGKFFKKKEYASWIEERQKKPAVSQNSGDTQN